MGTSKPPEWHLLLRAVEAVCAAAPGPLVVGYSGGMDSTVLLHALAGRAELRTSGLRAIHVHHGWSDRADQWVSHCERHCLAWSVPLEIVRVQIDFSSGHGPEAAARKARYQAISHRLLGAECLLTAQHADDQAETLLLQLLRGAGLDGLAGMRARVRVFGCRIWRPVLEVPRSALLAYARHHGLTWVDDPSNAEPRLARGFLRQQVLPLLAQRWPAVRRNLAQCAGLLRADSELLATTVQQALAACRGLDPRSLLIQPLNAVPATLQPRLLRAWLKQLGLPAPPRALLHRLLTELPRLQPDAEACWRFGSQAIRRFREMLWAGPLPRHPDWQLAWDGSAIDLPAGLGRIAWTGAARNWMLHCRRGGERIQVRGIRRPLKNLLQELAVPPWERERLVLLSSIEADGALQLRALPGLLLDDQLYGLLQQGARLEFHGEGVQGY